MTSPKTILDQALEGEVTLRGSQSKLETLRWLLYNERRKDRNLARKLHGPDGVSRYDILHMSLTFNLQEGTWELKIRHQEDVLKDISILHSAPGGVLPGS